jgi:hypothetical protein
VMDLLLHRFIPGKSEAERRLPLPPWFRRNPSSRLCAVALFLMQVSKEFYQIPRSRFPANSCPIHRNPYLS